MGNLVDNALQHGDGPIALSALRGTASIELHVTDEGPGFPPDFIANAFERFARAERARSTDGSGVGLAIVKTIAQAHGGDAQASNRPGHGADTRIELPDLPSSDAATDPLRPDEQPMNPRDPLHPRVIRRA
jgi:two-component system, OmpR family, sensor kinase